MSPYREDEFDIPLLTRRLAILSLEDSPPNNHVTMFFKRMCRTRSPTMKEKGYKGIRSNLGLYEARGTYLVGVENYQLVHLERYMFIYCKPQYVFEDSPLYSIMRSNAFTQRNPSKWYNVLRGVASGRCGPTLPLLDRPSNEMFRDWSYRVDRDSTDSTIKLLDQYAAWDFADDSIVGEVEFAPNVLVTRRIAIEDLLQVRSRLPHAFLELAPDIELAIKTFLEIEFGIVDYDFEQTFE